MATLYGDLSNNQEVGSFDGSLVLRIAAKRNISPYFTVFPRDSLAADVSGNKTISSFDASLIFRYTVGLISSFPAQAPATNLPKSNIELEPMILYSQADWIEKQKVKITFRNANLPSFYSMQAEITFDPMTLTPLTFLPCGELKSFFSEWNYWDHNLCLALAGTRPARCADTLFAIIFQAAADEPAPVFDQLSINTFELDEMPIPVFVEKNTSIPERFFVSQNYPNPFNTATVFKIWLPKIAKPAWPKLQVEIYNILGQKIKILANRATVPGYYSFSWLADSDDNVFVSSGLYLLKVKYAHFQEIKKMILVR